MKRKCIEHIQWCHSVQPVMMPNPDPDRKQLPCVVPALFGKLNYLFATHTNYCCELYIHNTRSHCCRIAISRLYMYTVAQSSPIIMCLIQTAASRRKVWCCPSSSPPKWTFSKCELFFFVLFGCVPRAKRLLHHKTCLIIRFVCVFPRVARCWLT